MFTNIHFTQNIYGNEYSSSSLYYSSSINQSSSIQGLSLYNQAHGILLLSMKL